MFIDTEPHRSRPAEFVKRAGEYSLTNAAGRISDRSVSINIQPLTGLGTSLRKFVIVKDQHS